MAAPASQETVVFQKFLEGKKILIVDPSSSARSGLFKIFKDLGVKQQCLILANAFNQAVQIIAEQKPHVVIAEYDLGKKCGLELLQTQREQRPTESKNMIFVLATGNTSQGAVARAAEEDIDAYLIKPFTPEVIRKTIMKAAIIKIKPPEYLVFIDEGKKHMGEGNYDKAEEVLMKAYQLDPSPSLACYYIGQIKFLRKILNESEGSYQKGLGFNKIHYKCMIGLYEILMTQKNHAAAYEVVKRVSQYFPANPKRLSEVLRLAITIGKYEDIERYYAVFCNIDERNDMLIKYICAALVVCGKFYLSTKQYSRAIELFQKASATGTGRTNIIKEIVQALLEYDMHKEAEKFLSKFPPESQSGDDYMILKLLISNIEGPASLVIDLGRKVLSKGIVDERVYSVMIQRSLTAGLEHGAENVLSEATSKLPAKAQYFNDLYKKYKEQMPAKDSKKQAS